MSKTQVVKLLATLKTERRGGAPREGWVKRNREILMMQVRNTSADRAMTFSERARHFFAVFMPMENVYVAARGFGVFLLVAATVAGGGIASAQFYGDAIPGEPMYAMKVAMEKVQLALAPNDGYRASLHTEFADRRMEEIGRLAEASASRQEHVPETLAAFERDLAALGDGLESLRSSDPATVVEVAKTVERKMALYQSILRKAGMSLAPGYLPPLFHTRDLVDGVSIKAMAVIVEKHFAGDENASGSVVASKFDDRIRQAENKIGSADTPRATEAKAAVAAARDLVKKEDYKAALVKMEELIQLTKDEAPVTEPPATPTEDPAPDSSLRGSEATEAIPSESATSDPTTYNPQPTTSTPTPPPPTPKTEN